MPTYAGYQSREGKDRVNYTEAFQKLGQQVEGAINTRRDERASFDASTNEAVSTIVAPEIKTNQSMQDVALIGANGARDLTYDLSERAKRGEITQAEFVRIKQKISDSWTDVANFASGFDQRNMAAMQAQADGTGTGWALWKNQDMSTIADISDSVLEWDDEGNLSIVKYDKDGNVARSIPSNGLRQPANTLDIPRFDIDERGAEFTSTWKDWMTVTKGPRGESMTITDARKNPLYKRAMDATIKGILPNDQSVAVALVDNGAMSPLYYEDNDGDKIPDGITYVGDMQYRFYRTDAEFNEVIEERMETLKSEAEQFDTDGTWDEDKAREELESLMIKSYMNDAGVLTMELTEGQRNAAAGNVRSKLEMQLGHKEAYKSPWKNTVGGGGKPKDDDTNVPFTNLYGTVHEAWLNSDASTLSSLTGDDTFFKWVEGGLQAYTNPRMEFSRDAGKEVRTGDPLGQPIEDVRNLSSYFLGETDAKGQGDAYDKWLAARKEYLGLNKQRKQAQEEAGNTNETFNPNEY